MCEHLMWCDVWIWASALQPHTHTLTHNAYHVYLLWWKQRNSRQRFLILILCILSSLFILVTLSSHSLHSLCCVLVSLLFLQCCCDSWELIRYRLWIGIIISCWLVQAERADNAESKQRGRAECREQIMQRASREHTQSKQRWRAESRESR